MEMAATAKVWRPFLFARLRFGRHLRMFSAHMRLELFVALLFICAFHFLNRVANQRFLTHISILNSTY
jgi:hypothetical protein